MEFKFNPQADTNGTSLSDCAVRITLAQALAKFGRPVDCSAYVDEPNGYDGNDWNFEDEEGRVFHLYSRWGDLRIGVRQDIVSWEQVYEFSQWLSAQISTLNDVSLDGGEQCSVRVTEYAWQRATSLRNFTGRKDRLKN